MLTPDEEARNAALGLAHGIAGFWRDRLDDRLLGVYLLGSLAHGGFNRRYSDIDIGLVAEDGLGESDIEAMRAHAKALSPALSEKLSLFWADRGFTVGRFPPLDRLDYLDCHAPLAERERVVPARPSLDEIQAYLQGTPFSNWAKAVDRFAGLKELTREEHKPFLRAFLYPARFAYSWITGRMASNDDAIAFLRDNPPTGLDMALIDRALACRHAAADPDSLFSERDLLPRQVEACALLIES